MDQRGFGHSGDTRGYFQSGERTRDDFLEYSARVNQTFGGPNVPHFSIGHSLGGCIQLYLAAADNDLFRGMTLVAPFIALTKEKQRDMDRLMPFAKVLKYLIPNHQFSMPDKDTPEYMKHWREDPLNQGNMVTVNGVLQINEV